MTPVVDPVNCDMLRLLLLLRPLHSQSIFEYNGAAIVAMAGNNCVAIGCDRRLGSNMLQTVSANFPKVFPMNDWTLVGFGGLATDVQTA